MFATCSELESRGIEFEIHRELDEKFEEKDGGNGVLIS